MLTAFSAVLPRSATFDVLEGDAGAAMVQLGSRRLALRWVGRAGVRQVREVTGLVNPPDVIVGSELSLAARAAAAEAGLGWADETGAAEIVAGDLIVSRSGTVPPRVREAPRHWTPSVIGVAEAILSGAAATVSATAKATGHSQSSTALALGTLTDMCLLAADAPRGPRSGRRVVDRDRLLDEYVRAAASVEPRTQLRCGVPWRDPLDTVEQLGRRWDKAGHEWAMTGALAAALLAPYLADVSTGEVYVDAATEPELLELARVADIEPMAGGRLLLKPFPTGAAQRMAARTETLSLVPWPRVYADLARSGVRGEEAAEHLREVIGSGR